MPQGFLATAPGGISRSYLLIPEASINSQSQAVSLKEIHWPLVTISRKYLISSEPANEGQGQQKQAAGRIGVPALAVWFLSCLFSFLFQLSSRSYRA